MSIPASPQSPLEAFAANWAGQNVTLPVKPGSEAEKYLAKILGQNVVLPANPSSRFTAYLEEIAKNGTLSDRQHAAQIDAINGEVI